MWKWMLRLLGWLPAPRPPEPEPAGAWTTAPPVRAPAPMVPARALSPRRVLVIDTETTGIGRGQRIVTLAILRVPADAGEEVEHLHLVFDPRQDCQPDAARIHGWDDWALRFQDQFADHAAEIHAMLSAADLWVMHNARFDLEFLEREFRHLGMAMPAVPWHCTMIQARAHWQGSAALDACLRRIGLRRSGQRHGALEDAFLTMNLYRWLSGEGVMILPESLLPPANLRPAPPRPEGPLPRRATKRRPKGPVPAATADARTTPPGQ